MMRGSGGIFFDIAVGPDLIRGGYSMQWLVWFFAYVCMYVCVHCGCIYMVLHSYLYHIGEPQRDEEIDGEETGRRRRRD